jgi:hypothetical protein
MGVRVPAGHTELIFRHRVDGDNEEMLCTIGVSGDGGVGAGYGQAQNNDLADAWAANVMPLLTDQIRFVGLTGRSGPETASVVWETQRDVPGTYAGACIPPNCALLIQKRTQLGGKRFRGRMYIPGAPEVQIQANGNLDPVYLAQVVQQMNQLYVALAGVNLVGELALFHKTTPLQDAIPPTQITSLTVAGKIATQRRRLR